MPDVRPADDEGRTADGKSGPSNQEHLDSFDGDRHGLADHLREVHGEGDEVHEIVFHHQGMEQEMLGDLHQACHEAEA